MAHFFFHIQFISEIYLFDYFYFMEVIGNKVLFFSHHLKKIMPAFKITFQTQRGIKAIMS